MKLELLQKMKLIWLALSLVLPMYPIIGNAQTQIDDYLSGVPLLVVKGNATTNKVSSASDLEFNPKKTTDLWVLNKSNSNTGSEMVIFSNAGQTSQTSVVKKDGNAYHFMCNAAGMAFGANGNLSTTSNRLDDNHDGSTFTGPTLWNSSLTVFGATPTGGQNGTHIDMMHMNPYSTGIAFDPTPAMLPPSGTASGNAYWVFDGYNKNIALNDFVVPHCTGCSPHGDGQIYVYGQVSVTRDVNVPSHMELDRTTGILYICEASSGKILWMDTKVGTKGSAMSANETYKRWAMNGASFGTAVTGLTKPCGVAIDASKKRLIVSDNSNGDIIIYNISVPKAPVELGRIKTNASGIMGLTIAPDGKIWYVNFNSNTVVRVDPATNTSVSNILANNSVSVYPNPVATELQVSTAFENNIRINSRIELYDAVGKKVNEFKLDDAITTLNLSAYANGIHFYRILNNGMVISNGKFIVSK